MLQKLCIFMASILRNSYVECSPERHGISPGQHIAVGVVFMVGGACPGADQDLEHGVESVEAEEVVDGCLGGGL